MTSTTSRNERKSEILKVDARGRVQLSEERRAALLDEFDRSGMSGARFAKHYGILQSDPKSGALFVFTNKRRNRIKILYFDGTGLWVMTKRLETGTFSWPKSAEAGRARLSLTPEAFAMLTDGIDLRDGCRRGWYERD